MKYIHIRLNELLEENGISKNRICKDLDQQRGNFNRYCRDRCKSDYQAMRLFWLYDI